LCAAPEKKGREEVTVDQAVAAREQMESLPPPFSPRFGEGADAVARNE
jgi:hypothetical protein